MSAEPSKDEKEDDIRIRAKAEWDKFAKVAALLNTVNEYMAIYDRLQKSGELIIVGSFGGDEGITPKHDIPSNHTEESWNELSLPQQYQELEKVAIETQSHMEALGKQLGEHFDVNFSKGPLKGEGRIMQKCSEDYDGDIRRVIDIVRCSMIVIMTSLDQAKTIIDNFKEGTLSSEWKLIRVKDGFEKPDNFLVGGYRDIKVNAKCVATGHLIEIQLHLQPYFQLKHDGGHKHYQFAREQKVQGITSATQILDMSILPEIVQVGVEALEKATDDREKVDLLERLGDLKLQQCQRLHEDDSALLMAKFCSEAVYYYDQALRIVEPMMEDFTNDTAGKATYCQLLIGVSEGKQKFEKMLTYILQDDRDQVKLPEMLLFPEINNPDEDTGMTKAVEISKTLLGERHPVTLEAKLVQGGNYLALVEEQRKVLGFDHPMVLKTLDLHNLTIWRATPYSWWDIFKFFNDITKVLEANLERSGANQPVILAALLNMCILLQVEDLNFIVDAPGSRAPDFLRVLRKPKFNSEQCPPCLDALRSALEKTVDSVDANKIKVGSRVAVWSWKYQNYWSGKVTELKDPLLYVEYDNGEFGWISPLRRHTLLLSHGNGDPATPLPKGNVDELQVGKRALIWYPMGTDDSSFYSGTIKSRDETKVNVGFDDGETGDISLDVLQDGSRPFCVTSRMDAGSADQVTIGDKMWVYLHSSYWFGTIVGLADGEEDKEVPTIFKGQFSTGDMQICNFNETHYFPEVNLRFSF